MSSDWALYLLLLQKNATRAGESRLMAASGNGGRCVPAAVERHHVWERIPLPNSTVQSTPRSHGDGPRGRNGTPPTSTALQRVAVVVGVLVILLTIVWLAVGIWILINLEP